MKILEKERSERESEFVKDSIKITELCNFIKCSSFVASESFTMILMKMEIRNSPATIFKLS